MKLETEDLNLSISELNVYLTTIKSELLTIMS